VFSGFSQSRVGRIDAGGGLVYGSELMNIGLNITGHYYFKERIRIAPNFSFFFPDISENSTHRFTNHLWELNIDGHYVYPISQDQFHIYGLAGFNMTGIHEKKEFKAEPQQQYNSSYSELRFGGNLGVGFQYDVKDNVNIFADAKVSITRSTSGVFRIGFSALVGRTGGW